MQPRVLLVDDEPAVIAAVRAALKNEPFEVIGATATDEAFALLEAERFDVLVSDEEMPHMKGSEFLARAGRAYPSIPRIMLSGRADVKALTKAVNEAEIFRFLAKPVRATELTGAIREALELGELARVHREVWSAAQAQHAALTSLQRGSAAGAYTEHAHDRVRFAGFSVEGGTPAGAAREIPQSYAERLSAREREIVDAMAAGRRVKEIAEQFAISTHTVRNHLKAVYRKLNVRSQLELVSLITRRASVGGAPR
jgi:DNA-binding NarL/FixJ family response regulator